MAISPAVKAARPGFDETVIACAPEAVPRLVNIFTISGLLSAIFVYECALVAPKAALRPRETFPPIKVVNEVPREKFSAGKLLNPKQLLNALLNMVTFVVLNAGIYFS